VAFGLLQQLRIDLGADLPGLTAIRIVGTAVVDVPASAIVPVTCGIRVGTEDQGTAVLPTSEPHADWMYWRGIYPNSFQSTMGIIDLDLRSMRKIDEVGQDLFIVYSIQSPVEGATVQHSLRTLVLLP